MKWLSPLRYPGGKGRLGAWLAWTMRSNRLSGGCYAEAYAGGAGAALYLLLNKYVNEIWLNDIDPVIYSFWASVLEDTDDFIELLDQTAITMDTREKCIEIISNPNKFSQVEVGFSGFFLNRVNRSGIIKGGVIGGLNQTGKYLMDARYNKEDLAKRIKAIARQRSRIKVSRLDALDFMDNYSKTAPERSLIYLDPPYYKKADGLYQNFYAEEDHLKIAKAVSNMESPWLVTYDNHEFIRGAYEGHNKCEFSLTYSTAHTRPKATELMFYKGITLPGEPILSKTPFPYPSKWDKQAA